VYHEKGNCLKSSFRVLLNEKMRGEKGGGGGGAERIRIGGGQDEESGLRSRVASP